MRVEREGSLVYLSELREHVFTTGPLFLALFRGRDFLR